MSAILVGEDASPCKRPILRHLQPLPVRRSLGFEADLKALVDGKVRALLIPASSSRPITKADFDLDKLSQYKVARHDTRLVFLTKKNAKRDELWKPNSLASEYVRNHSDVAKDPDITSCKSSFSMKSRTRCPKPSRERSASGRTAVRWAPSGSVGMIQRKLSLSWSATGCQTAPAIRTPCKNTTVGPAPTPR